MTESTNKIIIRDMVIPMSVGIHAFEKENRQRVIVNVEISVPLNDQWDKDDITTVLSYADVVSAIETIAQSTHINLVETFAERIAAAVMQYREPLGVRVRVEKPDIFDTIAGVGVEIVRTR